MPPSKKPQAPAHGFIPPHGGYRELRCFQKAEIIYDFTHRFCELFLHRGDRTIDQMVQAARSGKQNILEGSQASGTSKETEIKLMNVARASLEELLEDYHDFLRVRRAPIWTKDSKEALFVRKLGSKPNTSYESYRMRAAAGSSSKTGGLKTTSPFRKKRRWLLGPSA